MSRIKRENLYLKMALLVSQRATCNRLKVGAILTKGNHIVATGYNGPPKNEEHCNSDICNEDKPCKRSIHAEVNALENYIHKKDLYKNEALIVYVTHQPCLSCAKELVKAGVSSVYYIESYRLQEGLNHLKDNGITVTRMYEEI